jgi:hypothetical protein
MSRDACVRVVQHEPRRRARARSSVLPCSVLHLLDCAPRIVRLTVSTTEHCPPALSPRPDARMEGMAEEEVRGSLGLNMSCWWDTSNSESRSKELQKVP